MIKSRLDNVEVIVATSYYWIWRLQGQWKTQPFPQIALAASNASVVLPRRLYAHCLVNYTYRLNASECCLILQVKVE